MPVTGTDTDTDFPAGAVDVHAHHCPPAFLAALAAGSAADPGLAVRFRTLADHAAALTDADAHLAGMDRAGVGTALLSVPPPAVDAAPPGPAAAGLARALNEELLDLAERHAGRFRVLLALPLPDVGDSVAELAHLGGHPLVAGVAVPATRTGWTADEPRFEVLWRAAAERRLPLALHPAFEPPAPALADFALPTALDAPFATSVVAARLMLAGVLDRVPDLALVVPHLGGTLPYLVQRLVEQSGTGAAAHDAGHYLRTRVHLDTCSYHPPALRCAAETVGADRLLLGSDFPFRGSVSRAVDDLAGLPAAGRRAVLRDNAVALFGRQPAAATATTSTPPGGAA
jgi:predicted TIM-barrel fold metal-dependent hydrolase